ncbi:mCG1051118 [Mus musculus]|nr:mCG1051118 [Mus musculus]
MCLRVYCALSLDIHLGETIGYPRGILWILPLVSFRVSHC